MVRVRFLHLQRRTVQARTAGSGGSGAGGFCAVDSLEVDGCIHVSWDEALDRSIDLDAVPMSVLTAWPRRQVFTFDDAEHTELLMRANGDLAGLVTRRCERVDAEVRVEAHASGGHPDVTKVTVQVENATDWTVPGARRDEAVPRSLIAVHLMLAVDGGTFFP